LFEGHPDLMIAARKGSPLAFGHGEDKGAMYIGSDALPFRPSPTRSPTWKKAMSLSSAAPG
jgi:glucosamine--fructose-6-phosphate aminotransferase (isomerizing)